MTSVKEHRDQVVVLLKDINEKIRNNIIFERQKLIGFAASEAATNMFAVFLHTNNLITPGHNVNHRFFSSEKRAKKKYEFEFEEKELILDLLVKQEFYREQLCYGKLKNILIVQDAITTFFKLKQKIETLLGDEF